MKQLIFSFLMMSFSVLAIAQKVAEPEVSDPRAKAILDEIRTKYDAYKSLEADFTLTIELPEEDAMVQEGKIIQQGDKYYLDSGDQAIFCDENSLWLYSKNNAEVQINDVDDFEDDAEMLSPKQVMRIYEQEDFLYSLTNSTYEKGVAIQQIEFKPTESDSEYSKIRLTIDQKKKQIIRIKAFGKDASRYTFAIKKLTPNKSYDEATFVFDAAKYPGVHVEDLRID